MSKTVTTLIIMDGFGYTPNTVGNAILAAKTPNLDKYLGQYPNMRIKCSGMDVGLPDGQMGNSEVGHTNIGAGRVVYQELTRITKSIRDGDFYENAGLLSAIENCKAKGTNLHLMGLVSDGGVHSHNTHLYALLDLAKRNGVPNTYVHCLLDGRDVPPNSGKDFVAQLADEIKRIGYGEIATVMGRYYGMDRDTQWDRVEKAYAAMVYGQGHTCDDAVQAVANSYANEVLDEFVIPCVITKNGKPTATIQKDDSIIFFNFRPDRAREITRTFVQEDFAGFTRLNGYFPVHYVCMTQYDAKMPNVMVAYKPDSLSNGFGEYVSGVGLTQLRIAETTKYAHVTFFFNGGIEQPYPGEDRILVPTPEVATFDMQPEMSAYGVAQQCVERMSRGDLDVIILNFANCDMVGHTGVFDAAVAAVEAVDECVGKVVEATLAQGGVAVVTADHGNAEEMLDENGNVWTAHSTNVVPLIVIGMPCTLKTDGRLADIAPTLLDIMGLPKPAEMSGESLIASR